MFDAWDFLYMDAQNHLQDLQDRSRTSRSTSGTSRSSSRSAFNVLVSVAPQEC